MVYLSRLLKIFTVDYNIALLVTNYVVGQRFSSNEMTTFTTQKPALGKTWSYSSNNQVFFFFFSIEFCSLIQNSFFFEKKN